MNNSSNSHLVVIPTYNEIGNIEDFVNQIIKINVDILIVDDNSPDGTGDLVQKLSENLSQVNLLKRSGKLGLGSAYRDGFKWGLNEGYKYLIEMDADFSHSFSDLYNILQNSKNFDVVIGSRYIPGGGSNGWDFKRKLLSSYANKLSKVLLRSKINDMTSGFRSYSSEALNEINYFSTKSDGYSFQIEMTIRSIEKKLSIKEVPIIFTERSLGNSKMSKKIVYEAFLFLLNNGVKRWLNIKIT